MKVETHQIFSGKSKEGQMDAIFMTFYRCFCMLHLNWVVV
jgi:hypothetical protein